MKNSIFLFVMLLTATLTNAQKIQDKNVPAIIKSAFQKQYSDTKKVKWEKENGNYEAEFELTETGYSVLLDASGNIIETEIEISNEALPANAKDYVSKNYAGQKIKEAAKIIDAEGIVTFEAEIKDKDLIFDSIGNFIKETKE